MLAQALAAVKVDLDPKTIYRGQPRPPRVDKVFIVLQAQGHQITEARGLLTCHLCGNSCSRRAASKWVENGVCSQQRIHNAALELKKPVGPIVLGLGHLIHPTHRLLSKRGITWCTVCGSYSIGAAPRNLRRPCEPPTTGGDGF